MNTFVIKGNICYSDALDHIETKENHYLVCEEGIIQGVFDSLPEKYTNYPLYDHKDKLVIPGLVDLHLHAPQYSYVALGMDLELLDWLNTYTFPHEAKYASKDYATKEYSKFVRDLVKSPTTRAAIYATMHVESTTLLMDMLEKTGLITYVGKINMDRNSIPELQEESAEQSAQDTLDWLKSTMEKYKKTKPILTPRFIPSCTDDLMRKLSAIQKTYDLPVQSHLSENQGEIAWVQELCPNTSCYGEAYDQFDMFGRDAKTIMAHCVWSKGVEEQMLKDNGVFIAHCPDSNMNLSSGIAPIRSFIDAGQKVGLGSDVAGGAYLSLFRQITDTIQVSKLYWRLVDNSKKPLKVSEAFYLATCGGGEFFGKVGTFLPNYEADILVIDDSRYTDADMSINERLERTIYFSRDEDILHKFVQGHQIF